MKQSM